MTAKQAAARSKWSGVSCPTCGAAKYRDCTKKNGDLADGPHRARVATARAVPRE